MFKQPPKLNQHIEEIHQSIKTLAKFSHALYQKQNKLYEKIEQAEANQLNPSPQEFIIHQREFLVPTIKKEIQEITEMHTQDFSCVDQKLIGINDEVHELEALANNLTTTINRLEQGLDQKMVSMQEQILLLTKNQKKKSIFQFVCISVVSCAFGIIAADLISQNIISRFVA